MADEYVSWKLDLPGWTVHGPATRVDDIGPIVSRTISTVVDRLVEADVALRGWSDGARLRQGCVAARSTACFISSGELDLGQEDPLRLMHLFARAHLLALNEITDCLRVLCKVPDLPAPHKKEAIRARSRLKSAFPRLKDVRDSMMHVAERISVQNNSGPIELPSGDLTVGVSFGPGAVTVAGRRFNCRSMTDIEVFAGKTLSFGGFMDDNFHIMARGGDLAFIRLHPENLVHASSILQPFVNVFGTAPFTWSGRPRSIARTFPRRPPEWR